MPYAGALGGVVPATTRARLARSERRPLVLEVRRDSGGMSLRLRDETALRVAGPSTDPIRLASLLFVPEPAPQVLSPSSVGLSPSDDEDGSLEAWWWVGAAAAVLAVGALVIGVVVAVSSPDGFDAVGVPVR